MTSFATELERRLEEIRNAGLERGLRRIDSPQRTAIQAEGHSLRNFSSNDYLGFADEPVLKAAAIEAIAKYGAGSGSSRLICGSLAPHHELEEAIADFKQQPAALSFSSGFAAALGAITSLVSKGDVIILDKLDHACMIDAARLSGATLRIFAHNDLEDLEHMLRWARERSRENAVLVVTESVFSMDGDLAPLKEIADLKDKYNAWLMVDEAHATGLYGERLRGCAEAMGVSQRVEVQMGTLGKALGAAGGFICGARPLIELLINRARSFIFSTAPAPAACAAATAGIRLLQTETGRARQRALFDRVRQVTASLPALARPVPSPILPIIIGGEEEAIATATALRGRGYLIPAVRFPSVPRKLARLRLTLSAVHSQNEVEGLLETLHTLGITGSPRETESPHV
jgi:8-amino-7-oxononanoate synthase